MSPRLVPRLVCLAGLLTLAPAALAVVGIFHPESGRPAIRDFRPTEYRGHPQVYGVVQGPDRIVYIATAEGILGFDGARWTHYPMPTAQIYGLVATPDGRIWAGGNDDLGYFAPAPEGGMAFQTLRPLLPAEGAPWGRTTEVAQQGDTVYFCGPRGVARIRAGNQVDFWPVPAGTRATIVQVGQEMMVHLVGAGLFRLAPGKMIPFAKSAALKDCSRAVSTPMRDGRVLFCGTGTGAFLLDSVSGTTQALPGLLDDIVRTTRVTDALTLPDGTLVVATSGQGLVLLSEDLRTSRRLDRTTGLADNAILSLARDHEGGLWLGYNSGTARLALEANVTVFDATNGPTPGTIDCWGRHQGRLYVGTYDGLYRLEPSDRSGRGGRLVRINSAVTNLFTIISREDELVVSTLNGLYRIGPDDKEELVVPGEVNNNTYVVTASRRIPGRYYLGGGTGLTVVQRDATGWHKIGERLDLGDSHTAEIDEDGALWLATYSRGFWRVPDVDNITDWSSATFEHYHQGKGLPANVVWSAVTPSRAGLVFFTDKGSRRFDAATKTFLPEDRYTWPDAPDLMLTPTIVSGRDTWASAFVVGSSQVAASPLGRFTPGPDGRQAWRAASPEALQEVGFGGAAVMWVESTATGDVLWARGYNNTVRLDLGAGESVPAGWSTLIRSVNAEGHRQALSGGGGRSALKLNYSREPIVFALAAPHFGALDGLRYQTRLLGFSDNWSEPSPIPSASYTNLEGGPFNFEARAVDSTGAVSETARLTFSVAPPWHRSPEALAGYLALAVLAVAGYIRWRLHAARREQHRLEKLVEARTAELGQERLSRPHEPRAPHPAQRHHRLFAGAPARSGGHRPPAGAGEHRPEQRPASAPPDQRGARLFEDRSRQDRAA
jgi:hypothetical protein